MAIERISRSSLRCDTCGVCYATAPVRAGTSEELRLRASFDGWSTGPKADLCAQCTDGRARYHSVQRRRSWETVIRALRAEPGEDGLSSWSLRDQVGRIWPEQTEGPLRMMERLGLLRRTRQKQVITVSPGLIQELPARFALQPEEEWPAWCRALFSSAVDDSEQPEHQDHDKDQAQRGPAPVPEGAVAPATEAKRMASTATISRMVSRLTRDLPPKT